MYSSTKRENDLATVIRDNQEEIEAALVLDDLDVAQLPQFVKENKSNMLKWTSASNTYKSETSVAAQQRPQRELPFLPQANCEKHALDESEELSRVKKVLCNQNISGCAHEKNVAKQEDIRKRQNTYIRPQNAPNMSISVTHGLKVLLWLVYQSFVLGFTPVAIMIVLFGACWFFSVNYDNVLAYVIIFDSIAIFCIYLSFWLVFFYAFGKERVLPCVKMIGIPLYFLHNIFLCLRQTYQMPLLAYVYYSILVMHSYLLLRYIRNHEDSIMSVNMDEKEKRYHILSSDGTTKALFNGFMPYVIVYYLSSYYLVPFFMESSITIRILGRVIIMPFIYNLVDAYQNNLVMKKSIELQKYRMLTFTISHSTTANTFRFMVTNPSNLTETFYMTLVSSVFDVCLRISYIPRTIYIMRLLQYSKANLTSFFTSARKIDNLNSVVSLPSGERLQPSQRNEVVNRDEEKHSEAKSNKIEQTQIHDIEFTRKGLRKLIDRLNQSDEYTNFVLSHYNNRNMYMSQFEIQSSIFLPIILYLNNPLRKHFRFQTFSRIEQAGYNILVQFSLEVISQLCCITHDYYLYGIEPLISNSWKYNFKRLVIFQSTVFVLTSMLMAVMIFRLGSESW